LTLVSCTVCVTYHEAGTISNHDGAVPLVGVIFGTMANSMYVCVDVKSAQATAMQARVLERMHTEIERRVQAVDEALRVLEVAFLHDFGTQPHNELAVKWARTREHRDEGLAVLDKLSMTACHAMDTAREDSDMHNMFIQEMVDTLAKLKTQHREMQEIEAQMAAKQGKDWAPSVEHLHKLRQQRLQRPRILCSHTVSSRTGQGLHALRRALTGLMEETRLFAHVGAKVPLNYSMLERLAHEGREELHQPLTPLIGNAESAKLDANSRTISFRRSSYCTIRSRQQCPVGSKAYYELEILAPFYHRHDLLCGFASAAFTPLMYLSREGVGDDVVSWAVKDVRKAIMNEKGGYSYKYECMWKEGDVIGLACDLQAMQMLVSVNGSFEPPNGCVFALAPDAVLSGLFAAFSCDGGTIGYNLGEAPFKYNPPAADYCAFVEIALILVRECILCSTLTCLLNCCMCALTHAGSTLYLNECPCMVFVNADEHRPSSF